MEHDVPTTSDDLRIADNNTVAIRLEAKDCSPALLADSNADKAAKPLAPCQDAKFQFAATDSNGTAAKDLPAIWLNPKAVNDFVLKPADNSVLKPYPEIATDPKFATAPNLRLDLSNPALGITSRSTDFYDSIARRDAELMRSNLEYSNPINDTVTNLLGIARKFGIAAPSTPTFGGEIGDELSGARRPGDGMPLTRFPVKRGVTVGGSTNLITNNDYSFDVGANVSMRKVPDEFKSIYGSKAVEGRIELKWKF
jgi:hypothetical protein